MYNVVECATDVCDGLHAESPSGLNVVNSIILRAGPSHSKPTCGKKVFGDIGKCFALVKNGKTPIQLGKKNKKLLVMQLVRLMLVILSSSCLCAVRTVDEASCLCETFVRCSPKIW